jgi:hypothetical protein
VRKSVAFCLLLTMPATLFGQATNENSGAKTVTIERGQVLQLSLVTPLDSDRAHQGDEITFKLEKAIEVDQLTILPKDWPVHAKVTKVSRAGKNCKSGNVRWKLEAVTAPDGRKIKVQSIKEERVKNGSQVLDNVHLESVDEKVGRRLDGIGKVFEYATLAPLIVVFVLPYAIIFAASGGDCGPEPGFEEHIPAGTLYYSAVSKRMKVHPLLSPLPDSSAGARAVVGLLIGGIGAVIGGAIGTAPRHGIREF